MWPFSKKQNDDVCSLDIGSRWSLKGEDPFVIRPEVIIVDVRNDYVQYKRRDDTLSSASSEVFRKVFTRISP